MPAEQNAYNTIAVPIAKYLISLAVTIFVMSNFFTRR